MFLLTMKLSFVSVELSHMTTQFTYLSILCPHAGSLLWFQQLNSKSNFSCLKLNVNINW